MGGAGGFGSGGNQMELGQLVKQAQLPSYNFNVEAQNQYNRKTQKQTSITYDPIQIQFHDDNSDVVVGFFNDYYKYYYRDSKYSGVFVIFWTYPSGRELIEEDPKPNNTFESSSE